MVAWLALCLGSQPWGEECSFGRGFHRCALVPVILCREKLRIEQASHFSGKVLPRPKRVAYDSVSFRGTESRQQLLLIFNTKIQGNSEGKDTLLSQIERGEW